MLTIYNDYMIYNFDYILYCKVLIASFVKCDINYSLFKDCASLSLMCYANYNICSCYIRFIGRLIMIHYRYIAALH